MKTAINHWISLAATAALMLMGGCVSISMTQICAIPDSKTPMTMTPGLFTNVSESLIEELDIEEGIPSSMTAFYVKKKGKHILFDSGNGGKEAQLLPTLEAIGVYPEDIDYVFITHLHGDHIGGMVTDGKAVFTNAEVYVNKDEYAGWENAADMDMMKAYGDNMVFFDADDDLPCGIEAIKAYGHTPGHTMYRIDDVVFAGDIMHATALQLVNPDSCARFDQDQEESAKSRKEALENFEAEGLKVYGMHFPDPYFIQF